jgi:hypothetical protein
MAAKPCRHSQLELRKMCTVHAGYVKALRTASDLSLLSTYLLTITIVVIVVIIIVWMLARSSLTTWVLSLPLVVLCVS